MNMKIEELKSLLDSIQNRIDIMDMNWDYSRPYNEYAEYMGDIMEEYNNVDRKIRLIEPYELTEMDDDTPGYLMTIEDFIASVKGGMFIDYDGYGSYVKDNKMSDIDIFPSDILAGEYRKEFSHVMWFNR